MPRSPNILRPVRLEIQIPEDLHARLELFLFSELEGVVPYGAYSKFLLARIREFFNQEELDLGEFSGILPRHNYLIRSSKQNIEQLKLLLGKDQA
jgi:hypothetical protein